MDFTALPPEINSSRMYSGPGDGPLLAAATAWDQLAGELNSAAAAYRSVIAGLTTDVWTGPSSLMMANAIAPYVAWLHGTAAHAEQTGAQVKTAATAYQTAYAMTVPPPLIAANRTQLHVLIATNFFGQNSPAIALTEADYDRMWAQDVTAMYGYATSATTATRLTQFSNPPNVAAPSPAAAVPQAVAPTAQAAPSVLTYLLQIPALTSAAASTSSSSFSGAAIGTTNHALAVNASRDDFQGIGPFWAGLTTPLPAAGLANAGVPAASAVMGRASLVSTLSVPQAWAATVTPPPTAATPAPAPMATQAASTVLPPGMFGEAMLGTLAGRGVSNTAAKVRRPGVVPRSPAAG